MIKTKIGDIQIEANIYTLSKNDMNLTKLNNLNNNNNISEKLKTLLLLCITRQKNYNNIFNIKKENERVFLINNNILIKYEYYFINSLIEGNIDIKDLLNKFDYSDLSYDPMIFNEIINQLNHETLKEIDNQLSNVSSSLPNEPKYEYLSKNKIIKIFKDFILVNE